MGLILEIAEKVTVKSVTHERRPSASGIVDASLPKKSVKAGEDGFDIMANVIWAELGKAIVDELGSVIFSVGRPDEFRKVSASSHDLNCNQASSPQHHWTTTTFIRSLEFLAPSVRSVETLRSHPLFVSFDRRWQLPVYFQMRWKEIITKAEDILSSVKIDHLSTKGTALSWLL